MKTNKPHNVCCKSRTHKFHKHKLLIYRKIELFIERFPDDDITGFSFDIRMAIHRMLF